MLSLWLQLKNFFANLWTGIKAVRQMKVHQIPRILENCSKSEIYILLTALLIFILSGGFLFAQALNYQGPGPHFGGSLTEGVVGQPQFINPILAASSGVDMDLTRLVYAQLLKFDANENLTPDLASELPTLSKDQKTYTLKLKPNLKWQDGQPLSADDVLFTIQVIQNTDYASPLRPNWSRVKVDKIDDATLTFQLREVSASFISNFALGIIPKHIWENIPAANFRLADQNLKPIGSGPYRVSQIKKISTGAIKSITLDANKQYYQGSPYLSRINFKFYDDYDGLINAYQGKEIQSLGFVPFDQKAFLATSNKTNQYRLNLPQYQAVFFNLAKNAILNQKAVRQALWLATNREPIINDAYLGNAAPAYGPILEGSLGFNPDIAKTIHNNLDEAGQILNKAGWVLDPATNLRTKNKKPLEFNLVTSSNTAINVKVGQILQSQWSQLGIKVNLSVVDAKDLEQNYLRPRDFDAIIVDENVGVDPDPYPFWDSSQSHDPGLNISGFSNAEADKLLTGARQTTDPKTRVLNYQRFQQIINNELPAIFLVRSLYIYNVPKNLQGLNLNNIVAPSERFLDINKWYFGK
jgi:peptide/nickel transport system substrate-binding protein